MTDGHDVESPESMAMESAIPAHLRCARTRQRRAPDDYVPPYPSFVARHAPGVERVVMAYFGVQHGTDGEPAARAALADLAARFDSGQGPGHWDRGRWTDAANYENIVCAAYWDDPGIFDAWFAAQGASWTRVPRDNIGTFSEVLRPRIERYETLFSTTERREGIATLAQGMSDTVMEHAYWGGARDRIPASQTDELAPSGMPSVERDGARVIVKGHDHLCLIRSGQDWGDARPEERAMYMNDIEPVLRAGMDFLRDEGLAIGCYDNRFVSVEDAQGRPTHKSYGMSWWNSLAALERWAESHPTHLAIFGAAMKYLTTLGPTAQLRLYHEVTIARADEQCFEYVNCHDRTGMLRAG